MTRRIPEPRTPLASYLAATVALIVLVAVAVGAIWLAGLHTPEVPATPTPTGTTVPTRGGGGR